MIEKTSSDQISKRAIFLSLYLFGIFFLALYSQQFSQTLNQVILWVIGPCLAFYVLEPNISRLPELPKEYFFYFFLLVFAFLGYVNVVNDESFFRYVQAIVTNFILMIIVYFAINNIKEWVLVWKTFWMVCMVVCSLSFFLKDPLNEMDEYYRLEGLVGNANGTANFARVGIIAGLFIIQFYSKRFWRYLVWITLMFFSYVIILTASRGAFGNLIFIWGAFLLFRYFHGWRLIMLVVVLFLFGNIFLFLAEDFLTQFYVYQRLTRNDSVAGAIEDESRLQLYSTAWNLYLQNPLLGVGLNQFRYLSGGKISHTDILDIFSQLGTFAGIVYVSIYVKLANRIRKIKWLITLQDKHVYQLIILCFISELFFGLSNPNWFNQMDMIMLSLLIVYTTKIGNTSIKKT